MTVTSVSSSTFLSDTTILIRDDLLTNITDPLSSSRTGNEKFVMTGYPQRAVRYPIITVVNTNIDTSARLGMQSVLHLTNIPLEIRVWARNVKERDELTQSVINRLRSTDLTTSVPANLISFTVQSAVNVDEPGDAGIHSKVITVNYQFILGA